MFAVVSISCFSFSTLPTSYVHHHHHFWLHKIWILAPKIGPKKSAKRSMGMDTFYGDTFDNGFGSFETVKRAHPQSKPLYRCESINFHLKIESQAIDWFFATIHLQHIPISFQQKTYCYSFSILRGIPNYNKVKENDWVHTFPKGFVLPICLSVSWGYPQLKMQKVSRKVFK